MILTKRKRLMREILGLPGLTVYYPMSEVEGTTCVNYAPSTKGSLNGTITGPTIGLSGRIGRAYTFDKVNDNILTSHTIRNFSNFSFGVMINVLNDTVDRYIYKELTNGGFSRHSLYIDSSEKVQFFLRSSDGDTNWGVASSSGLSLGWNLIFGVANLTAKTMKLYRGSTEIGNNTASNFAATSIANTASSKNRVIGSSLDNTPTYSAFFDSLMQHFFHVNGLLTTNQMSKISNAAGFE